MSAETVVESPLVNFELLEPIPVVYGYTGVAVSVVFFQSLNQFLLQFGSPTSVRIDEMWKWRNLFVSWVHAVIVGTWDLSWLVWCMLFMRTSIKTSTVPKFWTVTKMLNAVLKGS